MKDIIQTNQIFHSNNVNFNYKKKPAEFIDFKPDKDHHYILTLKINNLSEDNYRLIFNENQLTVIILESIEFNNPIHIRNYKLNELLNNQSYDELKSFEFKLPENNFYLTGHTLLPKKKNLESHFW